LNLLLESRDKEESQSVPDILQIVLRDYYKERIHRGHLVVVDESEHFRELHEEIAGQSEMLSEHQSDYSLRSSHQVVHFLTAYFDWVWVQDNRQLLVLLRSQHLLRSVSHFPRSAQLDHFHFDPIVFQEDSLLGMFLTFPSDSGLYEKLMAGVAYPLFEMDHQDWNPTILRNGKVMAARKAAEQAAKPKMSAEAIRLAKLANDEDGVPKRAKTLSAESRQAMMRLRAEQKWSQRDLDMRCSFPANTVRDLESGKISPSTTQLNIINRVLKTGLKLE
jgi:DNA-binding transcriptional regulator YiaG